MLKTKNNVFEKASAQIFIFSMIANACSYLFQIIMGNMLSVENYGIINALIALVSVMSAPGSVIAAAVTKYSAESMRSESKEKVALVYQTAVKLTMVIQVIMLLGGVCFRQQLEKTFDISKEYVLITVVVSAISLIPFAKYSMLQGMQEYVAYGIQEIILCGSKLGISVFLVYIGLEAYGVLLALILSYFLQSLYCLYKIQKLDVIKKYTWSECFLCLKEWKDYIFSAIWVRIVILMLMNLDTLLVKMLYSNYEVGIFSSGMVITKIGMYLATALVVPMVPMIINEKENHKNVKKLVTKTFVYGIGAMAVYSVVLLTIGKYIVNLLFGERYYESVYYYPFICPYVVGVTGLLIVMNYTLAYGKMIFFTGSMLVGFVVIFIGIQLIEVPVTTLFVFLSILINMLLILNIINIFRNLKTESKK